MICGQVKSGLPVWALLEMFTGLSSCAVPGLFVYLLGFIPNMTSPHADGRVVTRVPNTGTAENELFSTFLAWGGLTGPVWVTC